MARAATIAMLITLGFLAAATPAARAYWAADGVALCAVAMSQAAPKAVSDGSGGAIVAWYDARSGSGDIYARRVNASGTPQWTANGVALCTATGSQDGARIVSDGAGGAIVVWEDMRNGNYDIYAQRIDASGSVQWTANGVAVCTASFNQLNAEAVSDGFGGAIVVWQDNRNGSYDVYAQRINAVGTPVWIADGVALCAAGGSQLYPKPAPDGMGGAYVAWEDYRSATNYDIYAQRVGYGGSPLWTADGVAVCTAVGNQGSCAIVSDDDGMAIVAWDDLRGSSGSYVYAQRLNASGGAQWTADGVALCPGAAQQMNPKIVADGSGGAIAAWMDYRSNSNWDVYAQRVDQNGAIQWGSRALLICAASYDQENVEMISDGANGAIIAWQDERDLTTSCDVYAQLVDVSGAAQWTSGGVAVSALIAAQSAVTMAPDGTGGAIFGWQDNRTLDYDIYVTWLDAGGNPGSLSPEIHAVDDVPGDQGGTVYVSWGGVRSDVFPDPAFSHYSIWRAIDPSQAAAALDAGAIAIESPSELRAASGAPVVRIERAAGLTYYWELVETADALHTEAYGKPVATLFDSTAVCADYHYFEVVAHTTDPMVYWSSAVDSGYSVDNLAPCPPLYLAGEQTYEPAGLDLTWNRNTAADLGGYRLYRGLTADFVPSEKNLLGAPCDTVYFDGDWSWAGGYYYKVSAVDVHGNESGFALLAPDGVTGSETPAAPEAGYLAQNFPNPFNPATRIEYGLSERSHVSLRVFDAAGRLVRELANEEQPAARHVAEWDGKDGAGRQAASGVYFYRLDAGSFTRTKKMILLR